MSLDHFSLIVAFGLVFYGIIVGWATIKGLRA